MTDYDELSYLRKLANKQRAKLQAFEALKNEITDLAILMMSKEIKPEQVEKKLLLSISKIENTLKSLNHA